MTRKRFAHAAGICGVLLLFFVVIEPIRPIILSVAAISATILIFALTVGLIIRGVNDTNSH